MKTPEEKYRNDADYATLVNTLEAFIHKAQFTPSEIREAAILASIHFEMRRPRNYMLAPEMASAFQVLNNFSESAAIK